MIKSKNKIITLCLLISLISCISMSERIETMNKTMESWKGRDFNGLLTQWGPPQQILEDGKGGKIYVYIYTEQWTSGGTATTYYDQNAEYYTNNPTATTYVSPVQIHETKKSRMFWVNKKGIIYRWAWKGL